MSIRIHVKSRSYMPLGTPVEYEPRVNVWAVSAKRGPTAIQSLYLDKDGNCDASVLIPSAYAGLADGELCVHLQAKTKIDPIEVNPHRYLDKDATTSAQEEHHLRRSYYTTVARASVALGTSLNGDLRNAGFDNALARRVDMASNTAMGTANVSPDRASRGEIEIRFTLERKESGDDVDDVLPRVRSDDVRAVTRSENAYRKAMKEYRETYNAWARSDPDGGIHVVGPSGMVLDPDTPQMRRFHLPEWEVGVRGDALPYAEWWLGAGIDVSRNVVTDVERAEAFFFELCKVAMRRAGVRSRDHLVHTIRSALDPAYDQRSKNQAFYAMRQTEEHAALVRCVECLHYMLYEPVTASGYASDSRYVAGRDEPRAHYAATSKWFAVPVESPEQDVAAGVSNVGDCDNLNIYAFFMNEAFRRGAQSESDATPDTSPWNDQALAALWMLHTMYIQINVLGSIPAHGNNGSMVKSAGTLPKTSLDGLELVQINRLIRYYSNRSVHTSTDWEEALLRLRNVIADEYPNGKNDETEFLVPRLYNGTPAVRDFRYDNPSSVGIGPSPIVEIENHQRIVLFRKMNSLTVTGIQDTTIRRSTGKNGDTEDVRIKDLPSQWFSGPLRAFRQLLTDQSPTTVIKDGYGTRLVATRDIAKNSVFALYDGILVDGVSMNKSFGQLRLTEDDLVTKGYIDQKPNRLAITFGSATLLTGFDDMGHDTKLRGPGPMQGTAAYARHLVFKNADKKQKTNCHTRIIHGRHPTAHESRIVVLVSHQPIQRGEDVVALCPTLKTTDKTRQAILASVYHDSASFSYKAVAFRRNTFKPVALDLDSAESANQMNVILPFGDKLHPYAKDIIAFAVQYRVHKPILRRLGPLTMPPGGDEAAKVFDFINAVFRRTADPRFEPTTQDTIAFETNKIAASLLSRSARIYLSVLKQTNVLEGYDHFLAYQSVLMFAGGIEKLGIKDDQDYEYNVGDAPNLSKELAKYVREQRKYTNWTRSKTDMSTSKPSDLKLAYIKENVISPEEDRTALTWTTNNNLRLKSHLQDFPSMSIKKSRKLVGKVKRDEQLVDVLDTGSPDGKPQDHASEDSPSTSINESDKPADKVNSDGQLGDGSDTESPEDNPKDYTIVDMNSEENRIYNLSTGRLIDSDDEHRDRVTGHTFSLHMTPGTLAMQYGKHGALMRRVYGPDAPYLSVVALANDMARRISPDDPEVGLSILQSLPVRVGEATGKQEPLMLAPDAYFEPTSDEMVRREALAMVSRHVKAMWKRAMSQAEGPSDDPSEQIYTDRLPRHRYESESYMEDGREESLSDFYRRVVHGASADLARADPRIRHLVAARPERRTYGVPLRHVLDASGRCLFMPFDEKLANTYMKNDGAQDAFARIAKRRTPVTLPHKPLENGSDETTDVSHYVEGAESAGNTASSSGKKPKSNDGKRLKVVSKLARDTPLWEITHDRNIRHVKVERDFYLHPKTKDAVDRLTRVVARIFGDAASVSMASAVTVSRPVMVVTVHAVVHFEERTQ